MVLSLSIPLCNYASTMPQASRLAPNSLILEDSHIEEVTLMGRGIFWLKLSDPRSMNALIASSPIAVDGRIISLVPWYRGFSASDFETRFHIPRHPVTLQFPSLAAELRPIVKDLGAHFGWVM